MATVHSIEIADGGNASLGKGEQIVETSNQLHIALLAYKVVDYTHSRPAATGSASGSVHGPAREVARAEPQQRQHREIG